MTPWSVRPSAGWPKAAARAARPSMFAAPSSSEYSEWTCRCAQAWVLTESPKLDGASDASRRPLEVLPHPAGNAASGRLGAVDPRLEEGDDLAVAAHARAVAGGRGLAAEQVAEPLRGHGHGGVRAALGRGGLDADALAVADVDVPGGLGDPLGDGELVVARP